MSKPSSDHDFHTLEGVELSSDHDSATSHIGATKSVHAATKLVHAVADVGQHTVMCGDVAETSNVDAAC